MPCIVIAFKKHEDAKRIQGLLVRHGYSDTIACSSINSVLSEIQYYDCGVILCGLNLTDGNYVDLYGMMPDYFEMILTGSMERLASRELRDIITITMPFVVSDLINTMEPILRRLSHKVKRDSKKVQAKRSDKEKKLIDKAKYLLMDRNNMTEPEAYRYIQKSSMDMSLNMAEMAEKILTLY